MAYQTSLPRLQSRLNKCGGLSPNEKVEPDTFVHKSDDRCLPHHVYELAVAAFFLVLLTVFFAALALASFACIALGVNSQGLNS